MARLYRAFTIVELMIVVMILAIMAAVAVPLATSSRDSQCAAAARMLTADLELAQSVALARQYPVALVFSADLQSYKVVMVGGQSLLDYASLVAIDHPGKPGDTYEISMAGELQLPDVVVSSVSFGGFRYIMFDTFGSPAVGGTVVLRAGDATLTVTVQAITGAVSVS